MNLLQQLKLNFSLSKLTTLNIGGPAKAFITSKTEVEILEAIKYAKENNLKFLVIGNGSNLLVSDEGFDGLIIKNEITGIEQNGNQLTVKSGTILQDLVNFANENGFEGLQKLAGIPGTIGGAIYGNAGAYGQTISDHIIEIAVIDPVILVNTMHPGSSKLNDSGGTNVSPASGSRSDRDPNDTLTNTLTKEECQFNYRDSTFKRNQLILFEAKFQLTKGNSSLLKQESEEILVKRSIKYPKGVKCPGSFFKNIVVESLPKEILEKIPQEKIMYGKIPAGSLLEDVGAKGQKLGNIEIANYHANLFINKGGGTAIDFYNLASKFAQKVKEKFGITLEPEVQLINLPSI